MKELNILFGVAIGVVIGTLLYKHNSDARKIVGKCETSLAKEVEKVAKNTEEAVKQVTEKIKKPAKKKA